MRSRLFLLCVFLSLIVLQSQADASVILGQVETFDDPHHWVIGVGPGGGIPQGVPVELGGPGGPGDPYLSLVATGGIGPGSRLSAQNFDEWSGDYIAAGVNRISMDVRNFEATDLFLRLLFVEFGMMGPVSAAFSTVPIIVPGGSDWDTIEFNVSPSALTALLGTSVSALSNATELRIFHSVAPAFVPGQIPPVVGNLGVDNITAAASVPEPATWTLLSAGLLYGLSRRRIRRS